MKTINLGLQIVPKSKHHHSYDLVDAAIEVIKAAGVKFEITPFETVMEGPEDLLHEVARKAQSAVLEAGAEEILVYYRMQIRKEADVTMNEKTEKHRK
ncbi:thiamine-binding protein [Echinicola jeungdonensis]|uniref:MTH1187 family thiamine-binding protein n=1 Tax=Echinicola jeungdonensis TaxID=709343 RepID=A0ABV5J3M8_9BACT|nr:thiamine-binding protein [Echinicola jeungdonensis]MDN3668155.1 thiamine-binding protein [Echinicola jeungdonensis]